jgi:hypothetical protein
VANQCGGFLAGVCAALAPRRWAANTELAGTVLNTIRLKLLKIGAAIQITVRKVWVSLAESYPYQRIFQQVYENLMRRAPYPLRC